MNSDQSYWLVGASWWCRSPRQKFVDNKIWVLGYKEKDDESQYLKAKNKKGDRIAIKRMMGKGSANIKILHTGIVEGVVDYGSLVICVVNWLVLEKNIEVDSKGAFASIHGPYKQGKDKDTDAWLNKVFSL